MVTFFASLPVRRGFLNVASHRTGPPPAHRPTPCRPGGPGGGGGGGAWSCAAAALRVLGRRAAAAAGRGVGMVALVGRAAQSGRPSGAGGTCLGLGWTIRRAMPVTRCAGAGRLCRPACADGWRAARPSFNHPHRAPRPARGSGGPPCGALARLGGSGRLSPRPRPDFRRGRPRQGVWGCDGWPLSSPGLPSGPPALALVLRAARRGGWWPPGLARRARSWAACAIHITLALWAKPDGLLTNWRRHWR